MKTLKHLLSKIARKFSKRKQEFVEKYKYTEAEGIMLGAFISAGLWTIILYFIF